MHIGWVGRAEHRTSGEDGGVHGKATALVWPRVRIACCDHVGCPTMTRAVTMITRDERVIVRQHQAGHAIQAWPQHHLRYQRTAKHGRPSVHHPIALAGLCVGCTYTGAEVDKIVRPSAAAGPAHFTSLHNLRCSRLLAVWADRRS